MIYLQNTGTINAKEMSRRICRKSPCRTNCLSVVREVTAVRVESEKRGFTRDEWDAERSVPNIDS